MDKIELFRCQWFVSTGGHAVENGRIVPLGSKATVYDPFDYTALFQDFAAIESDDEGLISFANQYGLLWHYDNSMAAEENQNTVQAWKAHITRMRRNIQLWDEGKIKQALELPEPLLNLQARFDPFTTTLELHADSLLSVLYMQFALAVAGNKKYRQCAWCGTTFELAPGLARKSRIFCGDACRQAEYRHRKGGK